MPSLLGIVSSPYLYFAERRAKRRNVERQGMRAPADSPFAVLNTRRRRRLTDVDSTARKSYDQTGGPLFSKLPAELRQLIWQACIGGQRIHYYLHVGQLRSVNCLFQYSDNFSIDSHEDCWKHGQHDSNPAVQEERERRRLALLLTCRRIYTEAIGVLYSANFFDFSMSYLCLLHLRKLLLPARVDSITQISFTWECKLPPNLRGNKLDHSAQTWIAVWENLSSMKGLKYLRVELVLINPADAFHWTLEEARMLEPVQKIKRPNLFELILPFPKSPSTGELSHAVVHRR